MSGFTNNSGGGTGPRFYTFDYTTYNPNEEESGQNPPFQSSNEPQFFSTMTGFNTGEGTFQTIHGSFNSRLRRISDFEPVKHKRSRNGCYTCRARRVKCDEERPVCGRCAKSKRECIFPEVPKDKTSKDAPTKSSDDDEMNSPEGDTSIASNEKSTKSSDLTASASNANEEAAINQQTSPFSEDFSEAEGSIPQEIIDYMEYFEHHVSHHHYGFIDADEGNALRVLLSQHVFYDSALMYSVIAFCAFLKTMAEGRNSLEDFLDYYNHSLTLLRTSLFSKERLSTITLMTVLQLALLEEYLGDWVNLQSHQKAALNIINEMFTPETLVQDPLNRILLHWYIRFDQFTAFISHNETLLGVEWWESDRILTDHDFNNAYDEDKLVRVSCDKDLRWLSKEITLLFTGNREAPQADASARLQNLAIALETWRNDFELPLLRQAHMPITPGSSISFDQPSGEDHDSNRMWAAKHLIVHFWNLQLMFQYLLAMVQQQQPSEEFTIRAKRICELMEDIAQNDPHPDAILGIRAPLAISSIVLGHDPEKGAWCQSRLSEIESRGYLYPSTFRKHVPDTTGNVMETESESQGPETKPMAQLVREWIEERSNDAHDLQSENLRHMAGIFRPQEEM